MEFKKGGIVKYDFFPTEFFKLYDAHLVFTGVTRNSKNVLKDVTDNIDKSKPLLETVDNAYDALLQKDYGKFFNYLKKSWIQKKKTSSTITESSIIKEMDEQLNDNKTVIAHKLCGAGNGGFFLVFSKPNTLKIPYQSIKIDVESNGVIGHKI
jgi:D-glycero-alpha-D-manno-heptose-7-phosphate kinase